MLPQRHAILIFFGFLLWGPISTFAQQAPAVKIERKPAYISAGPGRVPWNVTRHLIPLGEIISGCPHKDCIPALTNPAFISAEQADRLLQPGEIVMGIAADGAAKAYPIRILNWHEVVNDEIAGQPVLVSW